MQLSVRVLGISILAMGLTSCGAAFDGDVTSGGLAAGTTGDPVSLTNTVESPAQLQRGDVLQVVVPAGGTQRIDLSGVAPDADLRMAMVNLSTGGAAVNVGLQLDVAAPMDAGKSVVAAVSSDAADAPLQEDFDQYLRGLETALAVDQADLMIQPHRGKAVRSAVPALGSTDTFRVVASLSSISQFREVAGVLRCIGDRVLIYVDAEVDGEGGDLQRSDVAQLCDEFDAMAANEIRMIGEPSDLDDNGRVAVLLTPAVNRLGALGGGIITGFFFAADLQARSGSNPVSNEGEILYLMVPDSGGRFGTQVSREVAFRNLLPAVFPHELQHAISYNQHVILGDGRPEMNWLNEGISHLMEDLLGEGQENPSRYALYLDQPSSYSLTPAGSPGLVARGGIFLLLRYLYEQSGASTEFVQSLLQSGLVGVPNVEAAAATGTDFDQFSEFLLRFGGTLLLNESGISNDSRYHYGDRTWDDRAGMFSGVCTVCAADDGRGTELRGVRLSALSASTGVTLQPSTFKFFRVEPGLPVLKVTAGAEGSVGLAVIRAR